MAGHSKWANIKHKKAKEDAKRGQTFTKIIKEITVCAKAGGIPENNPQLRQLIEKAKEANMPAENIIRAVKKGTGELPGVNYEAITYEGYGPGGTALIIEALTDNKNRTVADLRHIFGRHNGNLAETGSVNWMFEKLGVIRGNAQGKKEDEIFEALLDFDVQDLQIEDNFVTITTSMQSIQQVTEAVKNLGIKVEHSELEWVAKNNLEVTEEIEEKAFALFEALEDNDDVQNVYSNLN
ncbi:YebC/PmpR family DNA-binding transcriptional regulator [Candidatus Chromulinivorax destructor]|uniref:Probable transcriptional regulatory protein C0J27_00965 n=1 Tax=Candidatus Chromulinivorax destructor TaxID=2066483 RepID=A0A345ZAK4_9BACT|nr:YebC/PmpR family DNA-binding transcriptional regulator [Candidatus Chromulinivorax destructor]AXK60321.1 YebC/PmpR family DNA-binding transcriptional regulator [Candidatus Chromulinivorax destructor]